MYVYEGDRLIWKWVVSTGEPGRSTRIGHFRVLDKIPNAYASRWNLQMPHWLGIYYAGASENGIHALPILSNGQRLWAGFLGQRVSYGCVILGVEEARLLYEWAEVGTPVDIYP
jgi:lipoprotein-anchoring transpeptidase ErfK/SrfK